ncbi:MAG: alpha/beta fold hydrolase [Planctomycetota bacterium]
MPFVDPPRLPDYARALRPLGRRAYRLERGRDAGKRLHFLDHGRPDATPVLLVHGNPTWSYLWRRVITGLDPNRFRCLAPDLLGFGLSDDLSARPADHTLERHLEALGEWIEAVAPPELILVGQDWGGPLVVGCGLRLSERVRGLVLGNTSVLLPRRPRGTLFHRFARLPLVSGLAFRGFGFPQRGLGRVQGDPASIQGEVARAYREPLRGWARRAGPLGLARAVPDSLEHESVPVLREVEAWARAFSGPVALVWGERDPILGRLLARHEEAFPQARVTRTEAGHFLQEEVPELLAGAIADVAGAAAGSPA